MITYKINGRRIEAWDWNPQTGQGTLVAVAGDRTGVPDTIPTLEQDDPTMATLIGAIGNGTATPEQIGQVGDHFKGINTTSAADAARPPLAGQLGPGGARGLAALLGDQSQLQPQQTTPGQSAVVREQVPDINEATNLAAQERGYQANVHTLQERERKLNEQYAQTPGFGPAPWAPIGRWSPQGQPTTDAAGNPIGGAVAAGQASFPENLRMPTDYAAAYRGRGAEAAAADLQARAQELDRRQAAYEARKVGAERLGAVQENRLAARRGADDLRVAEQFASSRTTGDRSLRPVGASGWAHGENAGLAKGLSDLDDQYQQMQLAWFPEEYQEQLRQDVRTGKRPWDYTVANILPPGFAGGGAVPTTYRSGGRTLLASVLPPGLPRFAEGGYSSGYAGSSAAGGGEGFTTAGEAVAPFNKARTGMQTQLAQQQRGNEATRARQAQAAQFATQKAQEEHAARLADLNARVQEGLTRVEAQKARAQQEYEAGLADMQARVQWQVDQIGQQKGLLQRDFVARMQELNAGAGIEAKDIGVEAAGANAAQGVQQQANAIRPLVGGGRPVYAG